MLRPAIMSLLIVSTLGGCATVTSHRESSFATQPPGLTYFLPTRLVRVVATRTPIDLAKAIADRDKQVVSLSAATAAAAAAKAKRELAQAAVDGLAATATAEQRTEKAKALVDALKAESDALKKETELTTAVDAARAAIMAIQMTGAACQFSAKLELLPVTSDRSARFVLQPRHSSFRDDTNTFVISPAGLLTSAHVVADDQTGQIIVEAAGALGLMSGLGVGGPGGARGDQGSTCAGLPSVTEIFDPFDAHDVTDANAALSGFNFRVNVRVEGAEGGNGDRAEAEIAASYLPSTAAGGLFYRSPAPVILELQQAEARPATTGQAPPAQTPTPATGQGSAPPRPGGDSTPPADNAGWDQGSIAPSGGTPPPVQGPTAQMSPAPAIAGSTLWQTVDSAVLMLPQAGPVSYIPMRASPFVKTTDDVQFVDGTIASWSSERPSELLAFARLPAQALDAFVSAFAKAVTLRIDISTNRESLGVRQAEEIIQAERNRILLQCIETARRESTDVAVCLPEED